MLILLAEDFVVLFFFFNDLWLREQWVDFLFSVRVIKEHTAYKLLERCLALKTALKILLN